MNFITQKRKEILFSVIGLSTLTLILGILAISLNAKIQISTISTRSVSMFDSSYSDIPITAVKNHHNFVLAGGFIGIFVSMAAIGISSFSISKMIYNDKLTIAVVVLSLIALIFSSIALAFNRDLSSVDWWIKVSLDLVKKTLKTIN